MKGAFYRRSIQLMAVGMILFASFSADAEGIVIICNRNVPDATLTREDVQDIFLGKKVRWSDGARIEFATHRNSDVHQSFLKAFIGRTGSQFSNHWKREVFTGKGRMPRVADDDQQMIRFVAETDGAVGYVSSTATVKGVAILIIQ